MDLTPVVIMLVLMALNVNVAISIGLAALSFFIFSGDVPIQIYVQRFMSASQSFPLLAIPLFVLTGALMNATGVTRRMLDLAETMSGHLVGGLAQVNVVLSLLLAGMSGSATADTAMQSKLFIPEMAARGYSRGFAAVVTAVSSLIAVLIPPSIGLVIYGLLGDVSIGDLFLAGIIPGILLTVLQMVIVGVISHRRGYLPSRTTRATIGDFWKTLKGAALGLLIPIGIIGGIRFGWFTPTEAAGAAVLYAIIVGLLYRELTWYKLFEALRESVASTAVIMFIICAASALSFYMSWENIPTEMSNALLSISKEPWIVLLMVNILLLILGMVLEGAVLLILLTPILLPVVTAFGIDPVHFGVIMVLNASIGAISPPVGTLIFVACSSGDVKVEDFYKELTPFLLGMVGFLVLLMYVPALSLWLPSVL